MFPLALEVGERVTVEVVEDVVFEEALEAAELLEAAPRGCPLEDTPWGLALEGVLVVLSVLPQLILVSIRWCFQCWKPMKVCIPWEWDLEVVPWVLLAPEAQCHPCF